MSNHKLVGLCGSLRKSSVNRKLMLEAVRLYGPADFIDADLQMACGNLREPIEGSFRGVGEWNCADLLQFHTELKTDYSMTFPATGNSSSDVRVRGGWIIEGRG